jgi:hypothetical protein
VQLATEGVRFHSLEYYYQGHAEHCQSDADILRNRQAVKFKGVIITQELYEETGDTVKYEHQAEHGAGSGEGSVDFFGPSPKEV